MKYSVIIPAFNAEKTIGRCLDSILAFSRDDVEILVINDGSTDNTEELCESYVSRYGNIRYFYKANGGVSSARNWGLENSAGKYIIFVDSDDYLCGDIFSLTDRKMPDGTGLLISAAAEGKDGSNKKREIRVEDREAVVNTLFKLLKGQQLNSPCAKVFCGDVVRREGIRFDERLEIGEDKVFVVQYVVLVSAVAVCNEVCYGISRENEDSLSRKKREDLSNSILLEHELLFRAVEESSLPEKAKRKYKRAVSYSFHRSAYTVISELRKFEMTKEERLAKTKEILEAYSERKDVLYYNFAHILFALPIRTRSARIVDGLIGLRKGMSVTS